MADLLLLPSPPDGHHAFFIEAASLNDVLFDQLDYLISHASEECPAGCPDCDRLEQVKKLLLAPFGSPIRPVVARVG